MLVSCAVGMQSRSAPIEISGDIHNYNKISAGWSHSLTLTSNGSIVGWGDNRWGMADPPDSNDFIDIAAGCYFSLGLKRDGSIVGWGNEFNSKLRIPDGNSFIAIAAGMNHSLALRADGSIVCWGDNRFGQCETPKGNDFTSIAAGFMHSLALKSDGNVSGWGANIFGEATAPTGKDFIAIAAGKSFSLALRKDGSLICWGFNSDSELKPPTGNDFIAIAAGSYHCLALRSDGSIVGWGGNDRGQARPPKGKDFIALAAGHSYSLALNRDGSIIGWGDKYAMEQPKIPGPQIKEKTKKEFKKELTEAVEVKNASDFRSFKSPPKVIKLILDEQINFELIYIEPGTFTMGRDVGWGEKLISKISSVGMVGKYPDDCPAREVTITKGFYIGKYKVTTTQFCHFLNTIDNPQEYVKLNQFAPIEIKDGVYVPKPDCENVAVNVVHWEGTKAFCDWLSKKTSLAVRLPTEAEWEFTARGPEGRTYPWGEATDVERDEYSGIYKDYKKYPHPWSRPAVDEFLENVTPDGVVGMAGWVGEWCSDFYGVRYLKNDVVDPQGPTEEVLSDKSLNPFDEKYHVLRRGAYTTARDFAIEVDESAGIYGFRIVVEPPVDKEDLKQCFQE